MKTFNPIFLAISILFLSLILMVPVFKTLNTSWVTFVTILTFSSGMMTLFMYTASLSSNEKAKKTKQTVVLMFSSLVFMSVPHTILKSNNSSMMQFSNKTMMLLMATILIITMMAISSHGHHPNQTISSSF